MPPRPITATVEPRQTFAVWRAAPTPVETPHPSRQARISDSSSGIGTTWGSVTTECVDSVPQCSTPVRTSPFDRRMRGG
jgi:hypothetical protein